MSHTAYLAYSVADRPVADAVVAALEQEGIGCWMAPRDLPQGTPWADAVAGAIDAARVIVLILSRSSSRSSGTLAEVRHAVASGRAVLAVRIQPVDPPATVTFLLATAPAVDVSAPIEAHLPAVVRAVDAVAAG